MPGPLPIDDHAEMMHCSGCRFARRHTLDGGDTVTRCHRFPVPAEIADGHWCGEFMPQEG